MRRRALLVVALLAGCGGCGEKPAEEAAPAVEPAPEAEAPAMGTVRGVVRLAEGAEAPLYPSMLIHGRASSANWPENCAPPKTGDRRPTPVGEARELGNVAVTATTTSAHRAAFLAALGVVDGAVPDREPVEHVVRIEDCRMTPTFVSATKGDRLTIENATDYPYFPRFGRSSFQQSLTLGQRRSNPLDRGGNLSVDCGGFGAACGRSDVVIMFHPAHTTSATDGTFALEVPAGMPVVVHGWHPLYEETKLEVQVEAGGETVVEIVMQPGDPIPEPEPPRDPSEPPPEDQPGVVF